MSGSETTKLDELFRKLPNNSGVDPRLIEAAKTELGVLKFRSGTHPQSRRKKEWSKSEIEKIKDDLQEKETEVLLLRQQLNERHAASYDHKGVDAEVVIHIKDRYTSLYDNEWAEAFDFFKSKSWNDIEIIITLQRILRASYSFCHDVAQEQLENIEGEALYPTASWMDDSGIIARLKQRQISQEIQDLAKLYQKTTGQECLPALQKAFKDHVLPTFVDPIKYNSTILHAYVRLCVAISWLMNIQDPHLVFIDKIDRGSDFDIKYFRKYISNSGDKFDYLVWPALLSHLGGTLISKGVAQAIKPINDKSVNKYGDTDIPPRNSSMIINNPEKTPRSPEDYIDFDNDDHNSWDRATPRSAPKVYKPATERDEIPKSPYFDPHTERKQDIPTISTDDGHGRYSSRSDVGYKQPQDHNLTVLWKKKEEQRLPSAP